MKVVPDTETRFQLNESQTDVVLDSGIEWIIGPYDEYGVEEGIQIKEKLGGEVISVTIGRGNEEKAIRKAMAMGVDEGILLEDETLLTADPLTYAKAMAELVKPLNPDIIFTGKMDTDTNDSSLGPAIAQLLNMPVITEVDTLEVSEGGVVAARSAAGRKEKFESKFPVVITADKGLNDPRYPKLPDIMKAKKKPLHRDKTVGVSDAGIMVQESVTFPAQKEGGEKIEGSADEVVSVLMEGLTKKEKIF